jgi:hypothetical protein
VATKERREAKNNQVLPEVKRGGGDVLPHVPQRYTRFAPKILRWRRERADSQGAQAEGARQVLGNVSAIIRQL